MSLKSKRTSPRAMPVETILTRYKSSQLKQSKKPVKVNKLKTTQNKAQSKHDIKITNKRKRRKLTDKSDKKDDNVYVEFHPTKLKRKMDIKKVILKPKHDYKVVADGSNFKKRKLNVPVKDGKHIRSNSESSISSKDSERSIPEMITLLDASDNMNDEDLMEILTCPSPVWWEDAPAGYIEDSLSAQFTQMKKRQTKFITGKTKTKSPDNRLTIDTNKLKPVGKEKDKIFLNKQSKLEALLGNIKDKLNKNKQSNKQIEENINDKNKPPNNISSKSKKDSLKKKKSSKLYLDKSKTNKNPNKSTHSRNKTRAINSKTDSLLLQNHIPNSKNDDTSKEDKVKCNKKIKSIEKSNKVEEKLPNNSQTNYHNSKRSNKSIEKDKSPNSNIISGTNNVLDVIELNSDETDDDLLNTSLDDDTLSILENMEIPIHDSGTSESNKTMDMTTLNDVGDKSKAPLIKDDAKANKLNLKNSNSDPNKTPLNISKALENDTSDFVTVYKIISKDSTESEKNASINSYFKKSKFRPKKTLDKLKDDSNESSGKQRIVVSNKEMVKYCLKCSAIFKTEDCEYCIKKISNA